MSITSFILGIISLVGLPFLKGGAILAALLAIIFGIKGRRSEEKRSYANIGLTLGVITIAIIIIGLVVGLIAFQNVIRILE
ncbi:MAG: hypothetical protein ABIK99_00775 [candidate division WOR-3 bacterium]